MPQYEVDTPDGRTFMVDAPEGASAQDAVEFVKANYQKAAPAKERTLGDKFRDWAAGGLRGAGSIGATILAPVDVAKDALDGKGLSLESNRQRRADMDATLRDFGVDTESTAFNVGKVATEIGGTLGVGGAIANGLRAVAPASRAAQVAAAAIESGGMRTGLNPTTLAGKAGDLAVRVAGGAVSGGVSAGAVDPAMAPSGAAIGGALPVALKGAEKGMDAIARAIRAARTPEEMRVATKLAENLGVTADQIAAMRTGPQLIPGYKETLPQMLQTPEASQLQRTLQTAGAQQIANAEKVQQGQLLDALGGIAPVENTVNDAANRAGRAIQDFAVPAERQATQEVSRLFDAVPAAEARMNLPLTAMEAAREKYLGAGTFGKGGQAADAAINEARAIGTERVPVAAQAVEHSSSDVAARGASAIPRRATEEVARPVPWDQLQKLRSSIGEAITDAQANGRNQAAAALTTMKNAIDDRVAAVAAGEAQAGEIFTPQAIDTWGQALAAHADKQQRFATGPQYQMLRKGADGEPAIAGAQIPPKFFNGTGGQVEDVQAFKRLIGDREDLARELKSFAMTEGVSQGTQAGDLGARFLRWADSRSGALRELLSEQELATLKQVGKSVESQLNAENLGRVSGPDTAQKLNSLTSLGALDSEIADAIAKRVPYGKALIERLRAGAAKTKANTMAELLADPARLEEALRAAAARNAPAQVGNTMRQQLQQIGPRALPVLGAGAMSAPVMAAPPIRVEDQPATPIVPGRR